jgi:transcriptional regulator with XRE-family HTH domain
MVRQRKTSAQSSPELRREIGQKLQALRLARGLTQLELGNILGKRYFTSITNIEAGRETVARRDMEAYAAALGVSHRWLALLTFRYYAPTFYA